MIEKMLEKFEELKVNDVCIGILCSECEKRYGKNCDKAQQSLTIDKCKAIVQEVAKEYGKDTNVHSNVEVGGIVMYDGEPFAIETVKCTKEPCRDKMLTMIAKEVHTYQKGE